MPRKTAVSFSPALRIAARFNEAAARCRGKPRVRDDRVHLAGRLQ